MSKYITKPIYAIYNPSKWNQRISLACVAAIAVLIAIYMGLYQWGLIANVWDPVFDGQTAAVLKSDVSEILLEWFRVPDAILGALAYMGDIIFAMAGSSSRWKDRPWIVILFGIYVIPPAIVSIILVIIQGTVLGKWCFLCLVTAFVSVGLIILSYQEVGCSIRLLYYIWKQTRNKRLVWDTLWGRPSEIAYEISCKMESRNVGTRS